MGLPPLVWQKDLVLSKGPGPFQLEQNINKSQNLGSLSHISLNLFFFIIKKSAIYTKKYELSNKDYLLLIFTFMCNLSQQQQLNEHQKISRFLLSKKLSPTKKIEAKIW